MLYFFVGASLGAILGFFIGVFWDKIREKVAAWLRQKGWKNSVLMDAVIKVDSVVCAVRSRIFVKTKQTGIVQISEETYPLDKIDDPDVISELKKRGYFEQNIMNLMQ